MDSMERLMAQFPKMAEAVKAFPSPELQQVALQELIREFRGSGDRAAEERPARRATKARSKPNGGTNAAEKAATTEGRKRTKAAPLAPDKTLDLNPKGKTSLEDFVKEKQPRNNAHDHNVVAAYWLQHIAELKPVTASMIYTCFRSMRWTLPADFINKLQVTASRHSWIDTADRDNITVMPQGMNYVEQHLPRKPSK